MWLIFNHELMKNLIRTLDPSIFTKVTYDRVIYDALTDSVFVTGGEEENVEEVITDEYVDRGLPSGLKWATMNVGAKTEEDYGHYYMWGSTTPNTPDECNWANAPFNNGATSYDTTYFNSVKNDVVTNKVLVKEYDVAAQIMGGDWRMPTKDECQELYKNTTHSWVTINGVKGRKFTSKKDTTKYIFIPAAGYYYNGSVDGVGKYGYIWSSTITSPYNNARFLKLKAKNCSASTTERCYGMSVRGGCQ